MDDYFTKARLLQIECKMNGMVAENRYREITGNSLAYTEIEFTQLFNEIQELIDGRIR